MERLAGHEADLTAYAVARLAGIPGADPARPGRRRPGRRHRRCPWPAGPTRCSPPCWPTSTASGCAAGASAPTRTSGTCWGSTGRRRPGGYGRSPAANRRRARGWCGSASAATTTAPTSTGRSPGCASVADGEFRGHLRRAGRRIVHPPALTVGGRVPGPRVVPAPPDDACWPGGIRAPSWIVCPCTASTTAHPEAPRVGGGGDTPGGFGGLRRRRRRRQSRRHGRPGGHGGAGRREGGGVGRRTTTTSTTARWTWARETRRRPPAAAPVGGVDTFCQAEFDAEAAANRGSCGGRPGVRGPRRRRPGRDGGGGRARHHPRR